MLKVIVDKIIPTLGAVVMVAIPSLAEAASYDVLGGVTGCHSMPGRPLKPCDPPIWLYDEDSPDT